MVNKVLLKKKIASEGFTQAMIAELLGVCQNTFSNKINGISNFSTEQATKICNVLNISSDKEKSDIFLDSYPENGKKSEDFTIPAFHTWDE